MHYKLMAATAKFCEGLFNFLTSKPFNFLTK
ncbi:hypothetical protein BD749_2800 [Pontibacter ramchanderi]|uniref:Uncharacterized protein n=1 Tax=Pontibacter ramchanderi TaxID=1179743 RepID=A0A2N3U884_9BACT|nr:hypothetical protein BD749_2800 [Pontibacter ramchanderi]